MSSWEDEDSAAAAEEAATTDVELLKRAWRNEKAAPEILRFDSPLVSRVREQIQLLVSPPSHHSPFPRFLILLFVSGLYVVLLIICDGIRRRRSTTSRRAASTTWWSRSTRWTSTARSSCSAPTSASACKRSQIKTRSLCCGNDVLAFT